jgi:hypothetical protein
MYDTSNIDGLEKIEADLKDERLYARSEKTETEIEDGDNLRRYNIKLTYDGVTVEQRRVRSLEIDWNKHGWKWMRFRDEDEDTLFTVGIGFGEEGEEDTTVVIRGDAVTYDIRNVEYDKAMGLHLHNLVEYQDKEEEGR